MIRPGEAAGLTSAFAESLEQYARDLTVLLSDTTYSEELRIRGLVRYAHSTLRHLYDAESQLRELGAALAKREEAAKSKAEGEVL